MTTAVGRTAVERVAAALGAAGQAPTPAAIADVLWLATRITEPDLVRPSSAVDTRPTRAEQGSAGRQPETAGEAAQAHQAAVVVEPGRTVQIDAPQGLPVESGDGPPGIDTELSRGAGQRAPAGGGAPDGGRPDLASWRATLVELLSAMSAQSPLHNQLGAARSLRSLRVRRSEPEPSELDEEATAERSAGGRWEPVLRPRSRRWPDLAVVVDESPATMAFHPVVRALLRVMAHLGAFRELRSWYLRPERSGGGDPVVVGSTGPRAVEVNARRLADPTGRRVILVLTDGSAEAWTDGWNKGRHSGVYRRLLEYWGGRGPVAVVSLVPPRLWPRHGLSTQAGEVWAPRPLAPNLTWQRRPLSGGGGPLPRPPIPVAELVPRRLTAAADALGGAPRWVRVRLLAFRPASDLASAPSSPATDEPTAAFLRFRSRAEPRTVALLLYLAASPLVLPFMEHVRRTFLPETDVHDLAAILFSADLVDSVKGVAGTYRLRPGVRAALRPRLSSLAREAVERELVAFGRDDLSADPRLVQALVEHPDDERCLVAVVGAMRPAAGLPIRTGRDPSARRQQSLPQALVADEEDVQQLLDAVRRPASGPFAITTLVPARAVATAATAAIRYFRQELLATEGFAAVPAAELVDTVDEGASGPGSAALAAALRRARGGLLLVPGAHVLADRRSWAARVALAHLTRTMRDLRDPCIVLSGERGHLDLLRGHHALGGLLPAGRVVSLRPSPVDDAYLLVLGYLRGARMPWAPGAEPAIWATLRAWHWTDPSTFQADETARALFAGTVERWRQRGRQEPVQLADVPDDIVADRVEVSST